MNETDLAQEETKESLKFLVEHFRKLAQDKDSVISQYREMLEKLKPYIDREQTIMSRLTHQYDEICMLKNELFDLKYKPEKKKRVK